MKFCDCRDCNFSFCPHQCEKLTKLHKIVVVTKSGEKLIKQFKYCPFHEWNVKIK